MSTLFSFDNDATARNRGLIVKSGLDEPVLSIDFSDGLSTSATVLTTVTATVVNSVGVTVTANCVNTVNVNATQVRLELATCGRTGPTVEATNGDQFRVDLYATPDDGGPLTYAVFVWIDNPDFEPEGA